VVAQHEEVGLAQVGLQARLFLVAEGHAFVVVVRERGQHKGALLADGQHAALLRAHGHARARVALALGLRPGLGGLGMRVSDGALSDWSDEIDGGISLNGSMSPEAPAITEAVIGHGQGPLAALEGAGLDKQQQIAAYGQLLASGQIQLNAQGVPIVQPGQVLQFDLSDTSAAQLGGRAIAVESAGRVQREALAQQASDVRQQGMSPEQAAELYTQYGGRSASYASLTPTWSGRMVDVPGGGVDALGNPTGMPEQVWVSDKPPTSYAEGLGNAAHTVGQLIDGAVQLGVNGAITGMVVRPASSIAALPALAMGGIDAYTSIQQDLQERWSPESHNPGAIAIQQGLGQMLQPVGQTLDQLRTASENRFGDGWTTAGFTAAQAALEVGGFLGGVAAIPAGRTALGNLGTSVQGGVNTLVDVMPVGSGAGGLRGLGLQWGAVGNLEGLGVNRVDVEVAASSRIGSNATLDLSAARAARIAELSEANAARYLDRLQAEARAANPNTHFFDRHGFNTTLEQQYTRASTGLTPDNVQQNFLVDSSRFLTARDQVAAIDRAQSIHLLTGQPVVNVNMGSIIGEGFTKL